MKESSIDDTYSSLFHYTTAKGLAGILESRTLWATQYNFLNDAEENRTYIKLLKKIIASRANITDENGLIEFLRKMSTSSDSILPRYVTCFCSHDSDFEYRNGLLSQWRGYGHDNGYAVEFDVKELLQCCDFFKVKESASIQFCDVIYYDELKEEIFGRRLTASDTEIIEQDLSNLAESIISLQIAEKPTYQLIRKAFVHLMPFALRIKNYGFHEEKEVRIIAQCFNENSENHKSQISNQIPNIIRTNFRPDDLVPYIKLFDFHECKDSFARAIKRIIIGPGIHQNRNKEKLEIFLKATGYKNVKITPSEIPYRSPHY